MASESLRITEIYPSIQGESSFAGFPCTFVRLTGCPLRCRWCDTAYAFEGGVDTSINAIVSEVKRHGIDLVELTGGEPLAQVGVKSLMGELIRAGHKVLIETGGSESIADIPADVHVIMDIKCPGSRMVERNLWSNVGLLKATDEVKFVLADRADFDWAESIVGKYDLNAKVNVLYSCAFGLLAPKDLAHWMVDTKSKARLQLQQHKYIWDPRKKGV